MARLLDGPVLVHEGPLSFPRALAGRLTGRCPAVFRCPPKWTARYRRFGIPVVAKNEIAEAWDVPGLTQKTWRFVIRLTIERIPLDRSSQRKGVLTTYARHLTAERLMEEAFAAAWRHRGEPAAQRWERVREAVFNHRIGASRLAARLKIIGQMMMALLAMGRQLGGRTRPWAVLQYMHAAATEGLYAPGFYLEEDETVSGVAVVASGPTEPRIAEAWEAKGYHAINRNTVRIPLAKLPSVLWVLTVTAAALWRLASASPVAARQASAILMDGLRQRSLALWATTGASEWISYHTYDRSQVSAVTLGPFSGYRFTSYQYSVAPNVSGNAAACFLPADRLLAWSRRGLGHHVDWAWSTSVEETGCWVGALCPSEGGWPGEGTGRKILFFDNIFKYDVLTASSEALLDFYRAILRVADSGRASVVLKSKYQDARTIAESFPENRRAVLREECGRLFDHPRITVYSRMDVNPASLSERADAIGTMDMITAAAVGMVFGTYTRAFCETPPSEEDFPDARMFDRWIDQDVSSFADALLRVPEPAECSEQHVLALDVFSDGGSPGAGRRLHDGIVSAIRSSGVLSPK